MLVIFLQIKGQVDRLLFLCLFFWDRQKRITEKIRKISNNWAKRTIGVGGKNGR
nr:MAG TPA: hypothetical protein [Caudoviricetes sp.]